MPVLPNHRTTRWISATVLCLAVSPAGAQPLVAPRIVIDGAFEDWRGPIPAVEDPLDDGGECDLTRIAIAHDSEAIYLDLELAAETLLQGLDGTATLLLDADGDRATGAEQLGVPGVDMAVVFSPPVEGWQAGARGITARSVGTPGGAPGSNLTSYLVGLFVGPTHAANRFELRLERGLRLPGTPDLLRGERFSLSFVCLTADGTIADRTDVLTYAFGEEAADPVGAAMSEDPLRRAPGTQLRVLSWNVGARAIVDRLDGFQRLLAAVAPDVLLLDELPRDVEARQILDTLDRIPLAAGGSWNVAISPGGGRQRVAVASRFRVTLAEPLARTPYPDDFPDWLATIDRDWIREDLANAAEEGVSSAGFLVEIGPRRLLAVPLDLQCCGRLGEPEDEIRAIQAGAVRQAIAAALPALEVGAVILAGDLNLVASRGPLDTLRTGLDVDGTDLAVLEAVQLDGRSAATWGFDGVFPSSRLDYFLYADSELLPLAAFVLDARDLAPEWQEAHRLTSDDARASGHLPIVADLRWLYPAAED